MDNDDLRADEFLTDEPGSRADLEPRRERTDIRIKVQAWPFKGEIDAKNESGATTAATNAITLLLLVVTATVPTILATVVLWLAHVSGLTLVLTVVGVFAVMFVICTVLTVHWETQARRHAEASSALTRGWSRSPDNGSHGNGQASRQPGKPGSGKASGSEQRNGQRGNGRDPRSKQKTR